MGELREMMQAWLDAEPSRKQTDLARAAGVSRNVVYSLMKRAHPKEPPRRKTLEGLARGMGLPYQQVRDAAYRDAGQRITEEPTGNPAVQALVVALDDASPAAVKAAVAAALAAAKAIDG